MVWFSIVGYQKRTTASELVKPSQSAAQLGFILGGGWLKIKPEYVDGLTDEVQTFFGLYTIW